MALGINNGWIDPTIQYGTYPDFAYNQNAYRQLINESQYESLKETYGTGCRVQLQNCPGETGNDTACLDADNYCYETVQSAVVRCEEAVGLSAYILISWIARGCGLWYL